MNSKSCPLCGGFVAPSDAICTRCALQAALDGGVEAPSAEPDPQKIIRYIGTYQLLEPIASGGTSTVWRALQTPLKRIVAIKLLHGGSLADPSAQQRFQGEAEAIAKITHPGIVPIYEIGNHEGVPYYVMQYFPGGSLATAGNRIVDDFRWVAITMLKVSSVIHFVHQHQLIHRDIKPNNILFGENKNPMVADFGLAKWLNADSSLTGTGHTVGTPPYMSPEQVSGESVTVATDIWSLGAVLYELLCGKPPFGTKEPAAKIFERIRQQEPPPLTRTETGIPIPRELATVAFKCLRKEPSERYSSAQLLADDLQRWLDGRPVSACPVGIGERLRKWLVRHPWQAAFFAVLPVPVLVAAAYIFMLNWLGSTHPVVLWNEQGEVVLPLEDLPDDRCTVNIEMASLWNRTTRLRLDIRNAPTEAAAGVKIRLYGDLAGWPDRQRSSVLTNGQVFDLRLPYQNKFFAERNLYFQTVDWKPADLLKIAPNTKVVLTRLR